MLFIGMGKLQKEVREISKKKEERGKTNEKLL
jgi:hypothetical protein